MDQSDEQKRQSAAATAMAAADNAGRMKSDGRDSRLSFRNLAESQLRNECKEVAMEKCDPQIKEFAQCSQEKGLLVVWSCRHLFKKISDCMALHNGPEAWAKYKEEHEDVIVRRANMGLTTKKE